MQAVRAFTEPSIAEDLRRGLGISRTFARILAHRGHRELEATRRFLEPRLADLSPPDTMLDRDVAAARLADSLRRGERVVVFGDYDVDGITSAAVLTSALRAFDRSIGGGATIVPVLASRFDGGYGFSARALERALEQRPSLIVTCDCGSSDHDRVAAARARGVDVIVIDHHLVPAEALPVLAFLNPHRPECGFPFKHLASCGLALSVAAAVRAKLSVAYDLRPLLDLVALGTVADVAPLVGDNRALVRAGLARLSTTPRAGLSALCEVAGIAPGITLGGEEISFKLAPRINAPGRLGAPDVALQLLLEDDLTRARSLAAVLEQACLDRRAIERKIVVAAIEQVEATGQADAPGIVVAADGWHIGVVGIVAARLVDKYRVPVVVVALEGAEGRGSVRGPAGCRLHDALTASKESLVGFGGHQAAAGVHVAATQIERLRDLFADACLRFSDAQASDVRGTSVVVGQGPLGEGPSLPAPASLSRGRDDGPDAWLDPLDEPHAVVVDLERFEPCGEGNRAPKLLVQGAEVVSARVMKEEHLRLVVRHGGRLLDAFGFGLGDRAPVAGETVDLHGGLRRDTFRGRGAVELRLTGVLRAGA